MVRVLNLSLLVAFFSAAACSAPVEPKQVVNKESQLCVTEKGTSDKILIAAHLLLPSSILNDGALVIDATGKISDLGKLAQLQSHYQNATKVICKNSIVSPGFVNAHEHPSYSYAFPDKDLAPIYVHRDEWRGKIGSKERLTIPKPSKNKAVLAWVELRHLLGGTTVMAGSGAVPGLLKNVAHRNSPGNVYKAEMKTFPFTPNASQFLSRYSCPGGNTELPAPSTSTSYSGIPYVPHVGEGTNCVARLETEAFLDHIEGAEGARRTYSAIHVVGATKKQIKRLAENDVSLIWSPRSNLALYGETANIPEFLAHGGILALGTDWSSSGSYNMVEEIACAKQVAQTFGEQSLSARDFWEVATRNGAIALGVQNSTGSIQKGLSADLVIVRASFSSHYRSVIEATPDDVIAVFVEGKPKIAAYGVGQQFDDCVEFAAIGKYVCLDIEAFEVGLQDMIKKNKRNVPLYGTRRQASCVVS
ncbi:MAG: amidohydrolase family protein [Kordiimonas sp.]